MLLSEVGLGDHESSTNCSQDTRDKTAKVVKDLKSVDFLIDRIYLDFTVIPELIKVSLIYLFIYQKRSE